MPKNGFGPPPISPAPPASPISSAPTPTPSPAPTGMEEGATLAPSDPSTSALEGTFDEPILTDIDSGAAQLLSTAFTNGFSDPFSSTQNGWIVGSQEVDPNTNAAGRSGPLSPYAGSDVDPYTNVPAADANPNAYTGGQNVNPYEDFQSLDDLWSAYGGKSIDTSQYLADKLPINNPGGPVWNSDHGFIVIPPSDSDLPPTATTPLSQAPIDRTITVPEVTIIGNPTNSDQALMQAIQEAAEPSGVSYSNTAPAAVPSDVSQTPAPGGVPTTSWPTPTPQLGSGSAPYDPMADSPFARGLLYGNIPYLTPALDFLTNDTHLRYAQNTALGIGVGVGLAAAALAVAPAVGAAYTEAGVQVGVRFPTATSIATGLGNALTGTTLPRVAIAAAGVAAAGVAADELPALGPQLANLAPTGPSFEGLIDPSEFENAPEIVDRLTRAREFDIGGYESLTGSGEFGRVWDNLDSDEALQNAFIRVAKGVERVSPTTANNPAIALSPALHRLIQNMRIPQMQGLTPSQVLQFHLQQMRGFTPDYVLQMLERESQRFIGATF
jgi:hypothetical protein